MACWKKSPREGCISPLCLHKIDNEIFEYMAHNSSISKLALIQIINKSEISKKF